ncbi:protein FAF-like, chloroplastic-like [Dorcoceras hygrometricum]|uniref:Protein FAF-like, chloroplastic-like n=1 Tax=Dorcoceras hygrometricum TaxID=472368 RepID=A0A2Z7B5Y4_9LAMI|nr:protein FAF-like, chloroplastic-like [Dorcoceras hygrometricum]
MRNKSFHYISSSPIDERAEESPTKQGIGAILVSDCGKTRVSSLRRTLSADMSSKKWLETDGLSSPVKKVASSEELVDSVESSSVSSEDECPGQYEVWASILSRKARKGIQEPGQMDVWGSILAQKSETCSGVSPPYVHPLVKRSSIALSEQSLEMCTECIGSETGSDGFCSEILSYLCQEEMKELSTVGDFHVTMATPFPPPLSSISGDGASIYMRSHRNNGRLILEAVSVPVRRCFQAQRREGRLLLAFTDDHIHTMEDNESRTDQVFDNTGEAFDQEMEKTVDGGGETAEKKFRVNGVREVVHFVAHQSSISLPKLASLQSSDLLIKDMMGLRNKTINVETEVLVEELHIPQPLPPRPRVRVPLSIPSPPRTPPSSFNTYEYLWLNKAAAGDGFVNSTITASQSTTLQTNNSCKAKNGTNSQDGVLMRGNRAEHFLPYLMGCKEFPRSWLIWETCSIATS